MEFILSVFILHLAAGDVLYIYITFLHWATC